MFNTVFPDPERLGIGEFIKGVDSKVTEKFFPAIGLNIKKGLQQELLNRLAISKKPSGKINTSNETSAQVSNNSNWKIRIDDDWIEVIWSPQGGKNGVGFNQGSEFGRLRAIDVGVPAPSTRRTTAVLGRSGKIHK